MERLKPLLLRIAEVAPLLDISRSKAYAMAKTGELPVVRLESGALRVPYDRLLEYVDRLEVEVEEVISS